MFIFTKRLDAAAPQPYAESMKKRTEVQRQEAVAAAQKYAAEQRALGAAAWTTHERRAYRKALKTFSGSLISPDPLPLEITELYMKRSRCPTQYEGYTKDGREVSIRYRHGRLSFEVNSAFWFDKIVGDSLDGIIDLDEIKSHLAKASLHINWPAYAVAT